MNAERVKRKLPSLLMDGTTTEKNNWNSLMRCRYRLEQLKGHNPEKFNSLINRFLADLGELEKAVNEKYKKATKRARISLLVFKFP